MDAVDVLGDAHAPDETGAAPRRARVPASRPRDVLSMYAGDGRRAVQGELREGLAPLVEALGARPDEVDVGQALVEDDPGHGVEEGDVRPRPVLDPQVGLIAQVDALGVDDDDPGAATHGAPEPDRDDRMVGRGVGPDDQQAAGLLVVDVGVGRGPRAHGGEHGLHGGRVTEPRAVVDVVRRHHRAAELLDDVAVLVGRLRAGEGAEAAAVAGEAVGSRVQGLVPRGLAPLPVALDHGARDPIARVHETGAEAALDAEHPLARRVRRHVVRHHREPVILADRDGDAAAHTAVRARGLDPADDLGRRLLGPERARRTGGHALAAGRADR